jgi:probable phosphoglycerate mutase
MLCELLGIDIGRFRDRIVMPTGAVSIVELSSECWHIFNSYTQQ